jgi:hypothetical protein
MTNAMTSFAVATNATIPYVLIPDYELRAAQLIKLANSTLVAYHPVIELEDSQKWAQFSVANQDFVVGDYNGTEDWPWHGILPFIWRYGDDLWPVPENRSQVAYAPAWQVAPPLPFLINYNIFDLGQLYIDLFQQMVKADKAVMTDVTVLGINPGIVPTGAEAYIIAPIHESFEAGSKIGGFLTTGVDWKIYMERVLPQGANGVDVVVKSSCEAAYTYLLDGPEVTFLGAEDLHDPHYNYLEQTADFTAALDFTENVDVCEFTLHVYPTDEFRDSYTTKNPVYYTVAVVMIFLFTSAAFILYDCFVQRRQNKVMHSAVRTDAIVSSLFPAQVRDRLLEDALNRNKKNLPLTTLGSNAELLQSDKVKLLESKPIADLVSSWQRTCTLHPKYPKH